MSVKVIANYLPQYHSIPENDAWWGKGYTDWVAVKKSTPLYEGHNQPRIPYNNNYYSLDDLDTVKWQAEIARKYGVYGFGIYHYWFNSQMHLLDKPVLILEENKDIDINYMFIWDNSTWKRTWSNVDFSNDWAPLYENEESQINKQGTGILAELIYGDEKDWEKHFNYLLNFFNDSRYIKKDNKPVFAIYNQNNDVNTLNKMCDYWDKLAKQNGFDGVTIIGKTNNQSISFAEYSFLYEPEWSGWLWHNQFERVKNKLYVKKCNLQKAPIMYDYDKIYKKIIKNAKKNTDKNCYFSGFVSYDDTPRRGVNGKIVQGSTPEKFEIYIKKLIEISRNQGKDYLFITAWNEWGEGAYLEPDSKYEYAYLESLKKAIESVNK